MTPIDPAILAKFVECNPYDRSSSDSACYDTKAIGFSEGYQLCAAEKQVEIDELKRMDDITMTAFNHAVDRAEKAEARIATLEQQRQQDREDAERYRYIKGRTMRNPEFTGAWIIFSSPILCGESFDSAIDAARAKEPHHD